jgi:hypothetical protein
MRKLIFIIAFILLAPFVALAQDQPTKASDKPIETAKPSEKAKRVILDKEKVAQWRILSLEIENARLKAEAAIPADLVAAVKAANTALTEFWKAVGIPPETLSNYTLSEGVDGAKILTKKEVPAPTPTPQPSKK